MSVVQTEYVDVTDVPVVDGQIVDTQNCDVRSMVNAGDDVIPFGRAVRSSSASGAGDRDVELGIGAATTFEGIAVQDERLPAGRAGFEKGDIVPVLVRGNVGVKVSAAVVARNDVVVATTGSGSGAALETEGQLSTKAANSTHITVTQMRFRRSAAAQGIAVVHVEPLIT